MRRTGWIGLIALMAALGGAQARAQAPAPPTVTGEFVAWCEPNWAACSRILIGSIEIAAIAAPSSQASAAGPPRCLPSKEAAARALLAWMRQRPERARQPRTTVMADGIYALWPCLNS